MSIVIYGPQGSGKTRHAEALRKHYRMNTVVDTDFFRYPTTLLRSTAFKAGATLYITNVEPPAELLETGSRRFIPIHVAMREAGLQP